jgi:galactose mutarotase-like enzyme
MTYQLHSDLLHVEIKPEGAELTSIRNNNHTQFLWQADTNIWPRHAPVLFPIVGKLKENQFTYEGNRYEMGQHGFARDMLFTCTAHTGSSATFELNSSEATKVKYPFDFRFLIRYQLSGSTLATHYTILNTGNLDLPASVGAHPGFNCPVMPGETFEGYYLEFEKDSLELTALNNGLRKDGKELLNLDNRKLPLKPALFDNDALVFENNQVQRISLKSRKSPLKITLTCPDWPCFGIWSKKGCNQFICLEPWYGIADKESASGHLAEKEGMLIIAPGAEFSCGFSIAIS